MLDDLILLQQIEPASDGDFLERHEIVRSGRIEERTPDGKCQSDQRHRGGARDRELLGLLRLLERMRMLENWRMLDSTAPIAPVQKETR